MPDPDTRYGGARTTGGGRRPPLPIEADVRGERAPYVRDVPTRDPGFMRWLSDWISGDLSRRPYAAPAAPPVSTGRGVPPTSLDAAFAKDMQAQSAYPGIEEVPADRVYPDPGPVGPAAYYGYSVASPSSPAAATSTIDRLVGPDQWNSYAYTDKQPVAMKGAPTTAEKAAAKGAGMAVAAKGGAPAPAKAPVAPAATGWEEEFYRTHGRFPSEWDYADKMWSVDFASQTGRAPTRDDWVAHAKQNIYNPARPATPEFAPGWGLDTGFGPRRPAPMSAVPAEVQIPGMEKGARWEKPTGAARAAAPAAVQGPAEAEVVAPEATGPTMLIPPTWTPEEAGQIFGQWLAEGGTGALEDWQAHLQAIGAG